MTITAALLAFAVAALLLTITPGVDTLLILRTSAIEGRRPAVFATMGIATGCVLWGAAIALGMGALFAAAPLLFEAVKWAGAAYLVWMGLAMLLRPRESLVAPSPDGGRSTRSGTAALWFRRGLLTNLLNPKVGIFYLSFLPQFVPAGYAPAPFIFLLACIQMAMGVVWLAGVMAATAPLGRLLARPAIMRRMDRTCGALFVALGARLALTR
jgi:threonine/homoserine/homoserine lactone efflux protein